MSQAPPPGEEPDAPQPSRRVELLGQVTARAVHAVKNSLAAIRSQAEFVQLESGGSVAEDMRTIIASVDTGAAFLTQLAELVRDPGTSVGSANLAETLDGDFLSFCRAVLGAGVPLQVEGPLPEVRLGVSVSAVRLLCLDLLIHACSGRDSGTALQLTCGFQESRLDPAVDLSVFPVTSSARGLPAVASAIAEATNGSVHVLQGRSGEAAFLARLPILSPGDRLSS